MPASTRKLQTFRHNTLAGKGRIAMEKDRHHRRPIPIAQLVLFRAHLAQNHRVHSLQMARVRRQAQVHRVPVKFPIRRRTEVILHIARSIHVFGLETAALEFVENRAIGFPHHIGQDAETPSVRHPHHDLFDPQSAAALDDLLHRRDQAFATIKAKTLGAHIFDMKEFLEASGLNHLVQDRLPALTGKDHFLAIALDPLFQPSGFFGVRDMHVLKRKGPTISPLDQFDNLAERRDLQPQNIVDENRPVHVGVGEPIGLGLKLWIGFIRAHPQGIEIRRQMPPDSIGPDQH